MTSTAEIGIFKITSESSSAANVRRIEALTGPEAIKLFRTRDEALGEIATRLRTSPEHAVDAVEALQARVAGMESELKAGGAGRIADLASEMAESAYEYDGLKFVSARSDLTDRDQILELSDRLKAVLGDGGVVLGTVSGSRPQLIASFTRSAVERGLSAADVIKEAAAVIGGGGGGRDTMAQAGGKDAERLDEALETAREAIEAKLS